MKFKPRKRTARYAAWWYAKRPREGVSVAGGGCQDIAENVNGARLRVRVFIIFFQASWRERETVYLWWAEPGGTAMPGQPVAEVVQAPNTPPSSKNQFNILMTQ